MLLRPTVLTIVLLASVFAIPFRSLCAAEPVRVYILAGQSNMEGHGFIAADPKRNEGKGSLERLVQTAAEGTPLAKLKSSDGSWLKRGDVFIDYLERSGPLTAGYGANPEKIGPELGFGVTVGDATDANVLLIKCAWGGKSLAIDFRPPSSGTPAYDLGEKLQAELAAHPEQLGHYYREMLRHVRKALSNLKELVPGSDGSYEVVGFAWHQGWNDRINDRFNAEYQQNMANFIRDLRRDLELEKLPFVIAETGMTGEQEKHPRALSLMAAQAAVASMPEFKGNVGFVRTRGFWREKEESPTGQGYHWNTNAETYFLIGEAMGKVMLELQTHR